MKKKTIALLLACCMLLGLLSACGGNDNKSSNNNQTPSSNSNDSQPSASNPSAEPEKVSLTVWTPSEDQNPDLGEWVVTMCNKFNEAHPEWDITFNYGVCTESDAKKLVTQDVDAAADVFLFGSTGLETLCQANALTEWGGSYKQFVEDNYSKNLVDTLIFDGGLYGIPITTDTYFMY